MTSTTSHSILDTILEHKRTTELPLRKLTTSPREMRRLAESVDYETNDFAQALHRPDGRVALIAEVKRASPSRGALVKGDFRPVELARIYETSGAAAISVLTDERFFKGALDYLVAIKNAVGVPVLRKDFIVDPYQLYEARAAGADAALLIVAALDDKQLADLYTLARELTLTPLVEVHDAFETERALTIGASVIGVNNRDLRTFVTDIQTTALCALVVADRALLVSESGIFTPAQVMQVAEMGAHAILVGESIITSGDIAAQIRDLSNVGGKR
jgi:indole-3-glycerol phosphate synthase